MRVKAKQAGFYNGSRVRPGAVFTLKLESHFSKRWMERVSDEAVTEPSKPVKDKPVAMSELNKGKKTKAEEQEVI